jgi:hypothetical protein
LTLSCFISKRPETAWAGVHLAARRVQFSQGNLADGQVSLLNFVLSSYLLNGTWLGYNSWTSEFQLCGAPKNDGSRWFRYVGGRGRGVVVLTHRTAARETVSEPSRANELTHWLAENITCGRAVTWRGGEFQPTGRVMHSGWRGVAWWQGGGPVGSAPHHTDR